MHNENIIYCLTLKIPLREHMCVWIDAKAKTEKNENFIPMWTLPLPSTFIVLSPARCCWKRICVCWNVGKKLLLISIFQFLVRTWPKTEIQFMYNWYYTTHTHTAAATLQLKGLGDYEYKRYKQGSIKVLLLSFLQLFHLCFQETSFSSFSSVKNHVDA